MNFRKPSAPFPTVDRIVMVAGQSLVMNDGAAFVNKVHKHTAAKVDKHHLESFGLFESAAPNFVQYYPGVTADDLAPKEGDFVYPIFRALSEVIVRKSFDPIDFTKNGVLKASMQKLLGQTVYPNHEALVGNELGVVSKVFWDEGYTADGIKVPAGINAEFKIDGKSHPNIARAVTSDPPSIHSNSVTVNFKWDKSHSKMSDEEFRGKVGTFDNKGELIRRIVNEVMMYNETSFVPHGADPFAQRVSNGKINNPRYAATRDSFADNDGRERRFFAFSYKDDLAELTEGTILKNNNILDNNEKTNNMNKGLILLFASLAGITIDADMAKLGDDDFKAQFDYAAFEAELDKHKDKLTKLAEPGDDDEDDVDERVQSLTDDLAAEKLKVTDLEKFKSDNEAKAKLADKVLVEKLAEAKRLYALTGKNDDTMISKLEAANFDTLDILITQFSETLSEKYPATCKDCGSTEVSMGSASADDDAGKAPKKSTGKLDLTKTRDNLATRSVNLKHIQG